MDSNSTTKKDKVQIVADTSKDNEFSILLRLPKFSHEFKSEDFLKGLAKYVDVTEIKCIGKLKYSNEWQVTLSSLEAKYKLFQVGKFTVRRKKCVIFPLSNRCVVGRVHWLPVDVLDDSIRTILKHFGEVIYLEKEKVSLESGSPSSLTRFFVLNLGEDSKIEDIPHYIFINHNEGLVAVKGRDPICLECREVGHRKRDCPVKKVHKYNSNQKPASTSAVSAEPDSNTLTNDEASVGESPSAIPKTAKKKKKASGRKKKRPAHAVAPSNLSVGTQTSTGMISERAKNSQDVIQELTHEIVEILIETTNANAAGPSVVSSSSAANPSSKKKGKKKKKKDNTSDNYDLVAAESNIKDTSGSGQHSPKGSLDSGIVLDGNSTSTTVSVSNDDLSKQVPCVQVNQSEAGNEVHTTVTTTSAVNQKKKKRNKKKDSTPQIPGLTHP